MHDCQSVMVIIIIIARFSCRRQGASADKLHVKAAKFLPLVGLARSKQDPINRGHGAQNLYRPPPAGAIYYSIYYSIYIAAAAYAWLACCQEQSR